MKIQIATLHFYNNFGSVLQAYALKNVLEKNFLCTVDLLSYRPQIKEITYFDDEYLLEKYREKERKFLKFREKKLGISEPPKEMTIQELMDKGHNYDAYITGSDIIWGKEFSALDPVYFLKYGDRNKPKIAYAASVILENNKQTENDEIFRKYVPELTAVGMRETSSVSTIQKFTKVKVTDVLDPTLLLTFDEYNKIAVENESMKGRPYLLSYFLTHDPATVDYTNLIAKKLGLRVVHYFADYPKCIFDSDAKCFAFAGPEEFIGYVKNATCIFTNSFHGTCFSIIYRKPFYTYMANRGMLSRVRDTIERLGLEERYFTDFRDLKKVTLSIDYSEMELFLQKWQKKSFSFLQRALEG